MNAEYRRELASFIDVIGFVDAGRVFFRPSEFGLRDLKSSGGLGTRIKLGARVFFGVDVAAGPEGVLAWFRGGHTF
jgi:hypothetical protein